MQATKNRWITTRVAKVVSYIAYLWLLINLLFLTVGFFLLLFGANPSSPFVEWVYRNVDRVMEPFRGIFAPHNLGTTNNDIESVLSTSMLFAMIMYLILVLVINAVTNWLDYRVMLYERMYRQELAAQSVAATPEAFVPPVTHPITTIPAQYPPVQPPPGQTPPDARS